MFEITDLPAVNASLNGFSALLILTGYIFVRQGYVKGHRACMGGACITSTLFLALYLIYHYYHGSTRFTGQGWERTLYFSILLSHTILATAIVPMVIITVTRALRNQIDRHKAIARWTFPVWMYVSVTGVMVYWMLYQWKVH